MKYQTILFDMDGTILDTLEDLQSSVNHMREKYGYPPCSLDEVRRFVGNGARVLMRRALPELMTPEREDALLEEYKAWYMAHNCVRTHPYAGIPALLLGGIYLLWRGHIDWRIPAGYIGTVVVITAIYGWLREYPTWFAIYHLLSGGLIIGAFFMATDWVTSPITKKGRLIYALGLGILTALIRLRGGYVEGVCYSILIMNMVTPLIDRYITNVPFGGGARHE